VPALLDDIVRMGGPAQIHAPAPTGKIGPNAVTRLAEALEVMEGPDWRDAVFRSAGAMQHLFSPPGQMVREEDVSCLQAALYHQFGPKRAAAIAAEAGLLTARYLLDYRIPQLAQRVLRWMPMRLAVAFLLYAIGKHAWTFAGSGRFSFRLMPDVLLTLTDAPVCRSIDAHEPVCAYYAATFEGVLSGATGRVVGVREIECQAAGGAACRFLVTW
jgi:divinyl protochlorophyllide a 8-vinyl-reductase